MSRLLKADEGSVLGATSVAGLFVFLEVIREVVLIYASC